MTGGDAAAAGGASGAGASADPVRHGHVSQSLALGWVQWGDPEAPVVILLHGMSDHARSWDAVAGRLRDRFRIVAPDLRGHGDSAWSPDGAYLLPYHVLDLHALVAALGVRPYAIVAHSFGGSVASRLAGVMPDVAGRLVLVDGLGPSPDTYAAWDATGAVGRMRNWMAQRDAADARPPRRMATLADAAARMRARNPRLTAAQARHLATHGTREFPDGLGWKFDPRVAMFAPEDFRVEPAHFWREIAMPTLIVTGAGSWTGDPVANGYVANFRDARAVMMPDAGHWPHHDQLDRFMAVLDPFLSPSEE